MIKHGNKQHDNKEHTNKYFNPRIDHAQAKADSLTLDTPMVDASSGDVYLDYAKVAWLGSMLILGTVGSALTISWSAVTLFIVSTALTLLFGHSLGMHRRFIHRSYDCPKYLEYLFVHLGTLVGLAGPMGMLKTHDMRDWAQRQEHCHAYFAHDSHWLKDAYWQLFYSIRLKTPPKFEPEAVIANDRVYYWMERTWMLQQLPWAILFYAIGGVGWVCWGIATRVSVSVLGHWLIGYFAHNEFEQTDHHRHWHVEGAAVQGHNIPFTALLTMGECWHNNHHAFPESANLGIEKGQLDPGWITLLALQKIGLVKNLKTPSDLAPRDELVRRAI